MQRRFTHQQRAGTEAGCAGSQHGRVEARMAVGDTAGGRANSSRAAEVGHVGAVHPGARYWATAASAEMGRESASRGGCCCLPLRKERSASMEGAVGALQRIEEKAGLSMFERDCNMTRPSSECAFTVGCGVVDARVRK